MSDLGGLNLLNPAEQQALATAGQLAQPLGAATSAATQLIQPGADFSPVVDVARTQLNRQFLENTLPLIQTQASLSGLGRSGAVLESIRRGRQDINAALVPIMQQDVQNRLNLIPTALQAGQSSIQPLLSLGATAEQRPAQRATDLFNLEGGLRAREAAAATNVQSLAEAERQLQQQAATAQFQSTTGRPQALAEALLSGLITQVPSGAFGTRVSPQLGFGLGLEDALAGVQAAGGKREAEET